MTDIPEEAYDLVRDAEGLGLTAYPDSGGVVTIGFGHTGPDVKEGATITEETAERLFRQDMAAAARSVRQMVAVPLNPNQLGALTSWTFNLGAGTFRKSTLRKLVNAGDFDAASDEFLKWVWCGRARLPGLVKRREAERDLFRKLPWRADA